MKVNVVERETSNVLHRNMEVKFEDEEFYNGVTYFKVIFWGIYKIIPKNFKEL